MLRNSDSTILTHELGVPVVIGTVVVTPILLAEAKHATRSVRIIRLIRTKDQGYIIYGKYIDLARAKSEALINSNLGFKSNNKLVLHNSVNFKTHSCDF